MARKLPKAERRAQLLETALAIVREEGADALTLGRLAERAGVSKPVAYEHFITRAGLMIALCHQIDAAQMVALKSAIAAAPQRLDTIAEIMAGAYMDCHVAIGPEWHAITAALKGDEEMDRAGQAMLDGYATLYAATLGPFTALDSAELHLRCTGLIGAGEAISRDLIRGRVERPAAVAAFTALIVAGLGPGIPR